MTNDEYSVSVKEKIATITRKTREYERQTTAAIEYAQAIEQSGSFNSFNLLKSKTSSLRISQNHQNPKFISHNFIKFHVQLISLEIIKTSQELSDIALIKQSRLSVMPIKKKEFQKILMRGNTSL